MGVSIVIVPLISFLESIAIVKAFGEQSYHTTIVHVIIFLSLIARKNGYKVDTSQELVALGMTFMCNYLYQIFTHLHCVYMVIIFTSAGLSNLAGSLVGSYPVTGSFSR